MSGSNSSARGSGVMQESDSPLSFTVHSMAPPALDRIEVDVVDYIWEVGR